MADFRGMGASVKVAESRGAAAAAPGVPWRSVALPVEHGAWSFLLEPVILGLVLAPTASGLCLALAALSAFLTRHPLRLAVMDRRKGARYRRTVLTERIALGYAVLALGFAAAAFVLAAGPFISPILFAAPLALGALALDLTARGRDLVGELLGSVALGASATAIVLAGSGPAVVAWMAWLLLALRAVTAILYVRARLQHERAGGAPVFSVIALHTLTLAAVRGLVVIGSAPWLVTPAFTLLLLRALGLLTPAKGVRAQVIGVQEVLFGITTLVLLAVGFRGW